MKYSVLVTADCTTSRRIEIEACNPQDAAAQALEVAQEDGLEGFEIDEGNQCNFYLCDGLNCVEEA